MKEMATALASRMIEATEKEESDLIDRLLLRGYDVNCIAPGNSKQYSKTSERHPNCPAERITVSIKLQSVMRL